MTEDYKDRNPKLGPWLRALYHKRRSPTPFRHPGYGEVFEIDPPDQSTTFLMFTGSHIPGTDILQSYLIEAPSGCPKRAAYETGHISFDDFLSHRGWLIQIQTVLFSENLMPTAYVRPEDVDKVSDHEFQKYRRHAPYQMLLNGLELFLDLDLRRGLDCSQNIQEIKEFYRIYGSKLSA